MQDTSFQSFINLVELDQRIDQLTGEALALNKQIADLQNQIDRTHKQTQEAYQAFHTLRKSVDALELDLKGIEELQREKRFKLGLASSPKEFFSLESEISVLEKKHALTDEQGIALINQLEEAQKTYESLKAQEPVLIDARRHQLTEFDNRLAYITPLRHSYVEQRIEHAKAVPAPLLAQYEAMKEKVANPVVEILKESCSSCFYTINKPDLLDADRGKLITCKDCYRLLYRVHYGIQDNIS